LATIASLAVCESLGGIAAEHPLEITSKTDEADWEFSLSTFTYLGQYSRDYVNPNFTADRDWLRLEARYNYEAIKTGSVWLGYNLSAGKKLKFEVTPMLGGVFGDITGVAPGYMISIGYKQLEFSTQGEYFFDAGTRAGDFFYSWSELSYSPTGWFRIGGVAERTQAIRSDSDVRRGPLIGFKYRKIDWTAYWLSPGSKEATFVFGTNVNF